MSESYEQLRDAVSGEAGQAWRQADREEGNLRALYRSLKEDPRFTEGHKAEKAWSVRWEIDGDLRWDDERQVWVGEDGFAYDGSRLLDYSRATPGAA